MTPTRSVPRLSFSPERLESQSLIVTYDFLFPSSAFASRVVGKSTIFTNIGKCASKIKAVETKLTTTTRSNCSLAFCLLRERKTQLWRDLNGTKKKSISSRYFVVKIGSFRGYLFLFASQMKYNPVILRGNFPKLSRSQAEFYCIACKGLLKYSMFILSLWKKTECWN